MKATLEPLRQTRSFMLTITSASPDDVLRKMVALLNEHDPELAKTTALKAIKITH